MTAQTVTTNLVGKEISQRNWFQRLGFFIVFLLCEAAILIFGSYYFDVFPTNRNLIYNLIISAVFLAVSLWFKYDQRLNRYWQTVFAFFMASVAYPFTAIFDGWIRLVLNGFSVTADTSKGLAIEKVCEMLLKAVPILVLVKLSGENFGSVISISQESS